MNTLKRVCDRDQVAYFPLATASVASFVDLMMRVWTSGHRPSARPRRPAFISARVICLKRHDAASALDQLRERGDLL
jgi:hypothetical protein